MEQLNFVIIGQQPWDTKIGSNAKDIALELSRFHNVLYVNSPLDRITSIRNRFQPEVRKRLNVIKGKEAGLIKIKDRLWNYFPNCVVESINWLSFDSLFDYVNNINNKRFYKSISLAIKQLGFSDYILFNDNEIIKCFSLNKLLKPRLSVYYSRDYILATPYWKKNGPRLEPQVIANYDLCLTNSTYLATYCKQYNKNTFYVGQGCDLVSFKNLVVQKNHLFAKVIGYVGALQSIRLDIELIVSIAKARPNWTIMLVGPEDQQFLSSKLHNLENVVFTGIKPQSELAGYINSFDVCINPQLLNDLTIGNYPRKIDEYLAVGKPTVATKTPAMDIFKDHVYLATTHQEYIKAIETAIEEDTAELTAQRQAFASQHTWENSVNEICKYINQALAKK